MNTYEVGTIVRIGRTDWIVRRLIGNTVVVARTTNNGRVFSKVFTRKELERINK